jgi:hypothetical protein
MKIHNFNIKYHNVNIINKKYSKMFKMFIILKNV